MKTVRQLTGSRIPALRSLVAVALIFVATACSSSETSGPNGRPSGKWTGSLVSGNFTVSLNLVMVEDAGGKVTGNGFISSALSGVTNSTALAVTGTFVAPNLSANLTAPGFNTMNLTGAVKGDTFNAQLNGSGFNNETMVLTRQ